MDAGLVAEFSIRGGRLRSIMGLRTALVALALGISASPALAINGTTWVGDDSLKRSVLNLRGRSHALVVVQRKGARYHVTIPLL